VPPVETLGLKLSLFTTEPKPGPFAYSNQRVQLRTISPKLNTFRSQAGQTENLHRPYLQSITVWQEMAAKMQ
jgi:hypothetical protein